ncbi:MAG TPA: HAMP domain-containing sensor histidine kinase [Polyangia bacterium]|jgi:signal transduction histidine kinase|nr:HAMP domain-containing sensor histidine kinase [Polyangia bacterium]
MEPSLRVLLIDDDEDQYVLTRSLLGGLRARRFELAWLADFDAGLEATSQGEHDVYLIDYRLGPRSGLDLLRQAIARGCSRPLILLTGQGEGEVDLEALRAGAADYLDKETLTASLLERSLLYAIERAKVLDARGQLAAARQVEEFQKQLLAIVGHDLRNPLSAVAAVFGYMQRSKDLPERFQQFVRRGRSSCERMGRIIEDLSDYTRARIGAGLTIILKRTNFQEVCEQTLEEVRHLYPQARILCEPATGADPEGEWDGERLHQVLGNLLTNAVKYGALEGPVTIRWWREGDGRRDLVFQVHNVGSVIPPSLLPRLFEPFERGAHDGADGKQGLGLGLFIVKKIVTLHGGTVSVTSEAEAGTVFTVRLPARPPGKAMES